MMDTPAWWDASIAVAVVTAVLLVAGVNKVLWPGSAARAMRGFRVVEREDPVYGRILGVGEIALGLWLFSGIALLAAATAIALLFAAFAVLTARAVWRGDTFACACFGGSSDRPISTFTVSRAVGLAVLALGIVLFEEGMPLAPARFVELLVASAAVLLALGMYKTHTMTEQVVYRAMDPSVRYLRRGSNSQ